MARWRCPDCPALYGAWLSRCPRCRSAKELEMALNACTSCTTKFAVGLAKCPHCGSTKYVEDGQPMAKITAHGGPSDKTVPEPMDVTEYLAGPAELVLEEGGEESSPGTSSSTSTETPQPKPEPSSKPSPKRARTTGSRSAQGQTESSSVPSTAGQKTEATSATDSAADE